MRRAIAAPVIAIAAAVLVPASLVSVAIPASAATDVKPARSACSEGVDTPRYACMTVDARKVPSGDTATFTGTLSATALANLEEWTKGDRIVCLTRYAPKPQADGSWPSTTLEGVCTTVRRNGTFTIEAEFGRKGTFYYGLEMGPCRGSDALCGNGDPGLLGVAGPRVVALTTT